MLGNTTKAVMTIRDALAAAGLDSVIFHSNGVGGPAMEELAAHGLFVGVIDFTTDELADELVGGFHVGGPDRLRRIGRLGLPQVVVPGCIDFTVHGRPEEVPARLQGRPVYTHNPEFTLVRTLPDEMEQLGRIFADRLNEATGPIEVMVPTARPLDSERAGRRVLGPGRRRRLPGVAALAPARRHPDLDPSATHQRDRVRPRRGGAVRGASLVERNHRMTVPVPVKLPSNNMADLAYPDIQAYLKVCDMVLVPMASTEQHGPHLPLCTDTVTAIEVASRVAKINNMLHTPAIWTGYSPQHMAGPGEGRGTITIRSSTLQALMYDVARSLIHHGFNKILFINGHGSNVKVVDPVLRKIRYDTGAMVGFCIPYMERYTGLLEGLMENPKDETPGWHASELETSQMLAHNPDIVRMDRAVKTLTNIPKWLPKSFGKKDGAPDIQFEGYSYFQFPMDHHEFTDSGVIGNPERATAEKGQEAFRRYAEHVAKAVQALAAVEVTIKNREFIDRV